MHHLKTKTSSHLPLRMALTPQTPHSHSMALSNRVDRDLLWLVATTRLKVAWSSSIKVSSQTDQVALAEITLIPSAVAEI